jgi:hypothetical protein
MGGKDLGKGREWGTNDARLSNAAASSDNGCAWAYSGALSLPRGAIYTIYFMIQVMLMSEEEALGNG